MSLYALKAPSGDLIECTVDTTRSDVYWRAFEWMSRVEGNAWRERFWKRDRATREHLRRRGYRVVRVTIIEARKA